MMKYAVYETKYAVADIAILMTFIKFSNLLKSNI